MKNDKLNIPSLVEEMKIRIDARLATKLATIDADIDEFLKTTINGIVIATLGLRYDSYRGFEINRTNGQENEITRLVSSRVSRRVEAWVDKFKWPESIERATIPKLETAIKRDYERALREKLTEIIKRKAEEEAIRQADALFATALMAPEIAGLTAEAEKEEQALLKKLCAKYPYLWERDLEHAVDRVLLPRIMDDTKELEKE